MNPLPPITFSPASLFSLDAIADLYTRTFADYFYPANFTAAQIVDIIRVEDLDMSLSPVLYAGGEAVGLATVGLRGERGYCRGFGVVVPYRGRGLSNALCGEVIRQFRLAGAKRLGLGVLQKNERAVKTYLTAGMHIVRDLVSFEWKSPPAGANVPRRELNVDAIDPQEALAHFARLHTVPPIWSHDLPSLREMRALRGLVSRPDGSVRAYVLYEPRGLDAADILDIAGQSTAGGVTLLRALQARYGRLGANNEPADSPMLAAYRDTDFAETMRRCEMSMEL
jgi:ribosomal protein S18 acetylase RimI-like enzyme